MPKKITEQGQNDIFPTKKCPDNTVKISDNIKDLTGEGLEYLIKDGVVIAKLYNGNFMPTIIKQEGNLEVTKEAA